MTAMIPAMPCRRFAASLPLAGHPPATDFLRFLRIFQVEYQRNVADVTFHVRGKVGVAAVEGKSMDAFFRCFEEGDFARLGAIGDVEHFETGLGFLLGFVALIVDQHHIAAHAHFVRMNPFGHFEPGDQLWMFGIAHVDY